MTRPRLVAELCAGLAPLSLALQGGKRARPPCSRPGNKAGYTSTLLGLVGLKPGDRSDAYLWCEPEDGPRAVLQAYPNPAALRAAATTIRGWIGEEPRPLWERLKAQGPGAGVPGWLYVVGNAYGGYGGWKPTPTTRPTTDANLSADGLATAVEAVAGVDFPSVIVGADAREVAPADVARWLFLQGNTHPGSRGWKPLPTNRPGVTANRSAAGLEADVAALAQLAFPPTLVCDDARVDDPGVVARWLLLQRWSFSEKGPDHGWGGPGSLVNAPTANWTTEQRDAALERPRLADLVEAVALGWPGVLVGEDAREVWPENADLDGCLVYIDPSYVGTTPYANNLTRAEVVDLALRWDRAGATVLVSEATAVEELSCAGWEAVRIDQERRGQTRTWSKQRSEWVTMNRPPVCRPGLQSPLFAVSA